MINNLEEFKVYNLSMTLADSIWSEVQGWDFFSKDTVGKQLVRAVDSIAANLSEGLGRYHYKEAKNFSYYSRGSLYETKTWLTKAVNRRLIDRDKFLEFSKTIDEIGRMLNGYIKAIGDVREPEEQYLSPNTDFPNT